MTPVEQSRLPARRAPSSGWRQLEDLLPGIERELGMGARMRTSPFLDGCAVTTTLDVFDDVHHEIVIRMSPDLIDGASENDPWGAEDGDVARSWMRMLRLVLAAPIDDAPAILPSASGPLETLAAIVLDESISDDGSTAVRGADLRLATPLGTGGICVFETSGTGLQVDRFRVDRSPGLIVPGPIILSITHMTGSNDGTRNRMVIDAPHARIDLPVLDALGRMRLEAEAAAVRPDDRAEGPRP